MLRNFSPRTMSAYLYHNQRFLQFIQKSPREIKCSDIRSYLLWLYERRMSVSHINVAHSALELYYGKILRRSLELPFQKKPFVYRQTLTKEEIKILLEIVKNKKHKLLIAVLYATGVRVQELVNIRREHLDIARGFLLVKQGKGRKDRYTLLPRNLVTEIETYSKEEKKTDGYLFTTTHGKLTVRTVEVILHKAAKKAGIRKKVTPHILRHTFAMHLLEGGTKLEQIQQLLGHTHLQTTQIYARTNPEQLQGIQSPYFSFDKYLSTSPDDPVKSY